VFKKANLYCFCSHKDEQNTSKSLEKEVILSWKTTVRFLFSDSYVYMRMCRVVDSRTAPIFTITVGY